MQKITPGLTRTRGLGRPAKGGGVPGNARVPRLPEDGHLDVDGSQEKRQHSSEQRKPQEPAPWSFQSHRLTPTRRDQAN